MLLLILLIAGSALFQEAIQAPPATLRLDPFYKKYLDADGLPVVASGKVPDVAVREGRAIVLRMTSKRSDILKAMIERKTRVAIMAKTEVTTDIPEHRDLNTAFPQVDWNQRSRGVGATLVRPACSGYRGEPAAARRRSLPRRVNTHPRVRTHDARDGPRRRRSAVPVRPRGRL